MPELPEVETIVRQLRKEVVGKRIKAVTILDSVVVSPSVALAKSARIKEIKRRGKYILAHLSNNTSLLIHLRMTGYFSFLKEGKLPSDVSMKYAAGLFRFSDNSLLMYNAVRRFERMELLSQKEVEQKCSVLGVEPLSRDCTAERFTELLQQFPAANIKSKLMDQHCIAGVGNIYAQEALYHAGIHPQSRIATLSGTQLTGLHRALQSVLRASLQRNGTTVSQYRHLKGKGNFQHLLAVYSKKSCPKGHAVTKITVGGRGAYFCGVCQK